MAHECPSCGNDDPEFIMALTEPVERHGKITGYRQIGYRCAQCRTLLNVTVGAIEEVDGPTAV